MATLIELNDFDRVGDALFYEASSAVQDSISRRFSDYRKVARDIGDGFIDKMVAMYEENVTRRAMNIGELMKQKVGAIFKSDIIRRLDTLNDVKHAPTTMRRWIMAEPSLRERYSVKGVSGYEGEFDNPYPDQGSGNTHYDYRRVMNGVVSLDENNNAYSEQYLDSVKDTDLLILSQQGIIRYSWFAIKNSLKEGCTEDMTSEWGGLL